MAEASDISGCVDVLMYGCLDIATAVLFHISAVHYTWMRGVKATMAAGHDYSLFDPSLFPASLLS